MSRQLVLDDSVCAMADRRAVSSAGLRSRSSVPASRDVLAARHHCGGVALFVMAVEGEAARTIAKSRAIRLLDLQGLYMPQMERDSCGVGFIAQLKGTASHQLISDATHMLMRMEHRGARGCEENTGDGAGILLGLPHDFLQQAADSEAQIKVPKKGAYGAGIVFFPPSEDVRALCKRGVEQVRRRQRGGASLWHTPRKQHA